MSRLARKVTPGKWQGASWANVNAIPADAFGDLKTSNNTLSFWRADSGRFGRTNRSTEAVPGRTSEQEVESGNVGEPARSGGEMAVGSGETKGGLILKVWDCAQRWWQSRPEPTHAQMSTETTAGGPNRYIGLDSSAASENSASAPPTPVYVKAQEGGGGKAKPKKVELSPDEELAVTALLGTLERLDKIDIVFVEEGDLTCRKEEAAGTTFMQGYAELHVDLSDLQHQSLVEAAAAIGKQIYGKKVTRLTRSEVERRIREAHARGIVDVAGMHPSIRADLGL